jgi:glycosyltransferase involved in cell wall biosynthesis
MLTPLAEIDFNTYKSNLKFVEAGALGMPLVASNVVSYNQDIVDGENGWVLPNKPYHWTKLLMKLLKDKKAVKDAGKKARQVVEQKYNLDNTVMDWFNCYNKIMEDFDKPQKTVVLKEAK